VSTITGIALARHKQQRTGTGILSMKVFEILTYIGAAIGLLMLFSTFGASGAPQEAAGAAMAVAWVVIPYCVTSVLQRRKLIEQSKPPV
jgi:ABC-type spermidine/putrescine transport system permease subunit II